MEVGETTGYHLSTVVRKIDNFEQIEPAERPKLFHWYKVKLVNTLGKNCLKRCF